MSNNKRLVWLFENSNTPLKVVRREKINQKLYENRGIQLSPKYSEEIYLACPLAEFDNPDVLNENDRWYSKEAYLQEVENLQEQINEKALFGALDHDEDYMVKAKEISHMITKLWYNEEDNRVWVEIKLIPTIIGGGCDAIAIVEAGGQLRMSARAIGFYDEDTKEATIDTIFTIDIVTTPGFSFAKLEVVNQNQNQAITEINENDMSLIKRIRGRKSAIIPLNEAVSIKKSEYSVEEYNRAKKQIKNFDNLMTSATDFGGRVESMLATLGITPKETVVHVFNNCLEISSKIKFLEENTTKIEELSTQDLINSIGDIGGLKVTSSYNDIGYLSSQNNKPNYFNLSFTISMETELDKGEIKELQVLFESKKKRKTNLNENKMVIKKRKLFEALEEGKTSSVTVEIPEVDPENKIEISYKVEGGKPTIISAGAVGDVHVDAEELEDMGILADIEKAMEDALADKMNESEEESEPEFEMEVQHPELGEVTVVFDANEDGEVVAEEVKKEDGEEVTDEAQLEAIGELINKEVNENPEVLNEARKLRNKRKNLSENSKKKSFKVLVKLVENKRISGKGKKGNLSESVTLESIMSGKDKPTDDNLLRVLENEDVLDVNDEPIDVSDKDALSKFKEALKLNGLDLSESEETETETPDAEAQVDVEHPEDGAVTIIFDETPEGEIEIASVAPQGNPEDIVTGEELEEQGVADEYKELVDAELNKDSVEGDLSESKKKLKRVIRMNEAKNLRKKRRLNESEDKDKVELKGKDGAYEIWINDMMEEDGFKSDSDAKAYLRDNHPDLAGLLVDVSESTSEWSFEGVTKRLDKLLNADKYKELVSAWKSAVDKDPSIEPKLEDYYGGKVDELYADELNESISPDSLEVGKSYMVKKDDAEAFMEYKGEKDGKFEFDNSGKSTFCTADELSTCVSLDEAEGDVDEELMKSIADAREAGTSKEDFLATLKDDSKKEDAEKIWDELDNNSGEPKELSESYKKLDRKVDRLNENVDKMLKLLQPVANLGLSIKGLSESINTIKSDLSETKKEIKIQSGKVSLLESIGKTVESIDGTVNSTTNQIKLNESKKIQRFKSEKPYLSKLNEEQTLEVMGVEPEVIEQLEEILGEQKEGEMEVEELNEMIKLVSPQLSAMISML